GAGDGAAVDQRALLAAHAIDVRVEGVVAGVEPSAHEPAIKGRTRVVEDAIPAAVPVDVLRRQGPETGRVSHVPAVELVVHALHRTSSRRKGSAASSGVASRRPEPARDVPGGLAEDRGGAQGANA